MRSYEAEKDQNLKTSEAVSKNQKIEKRKLAQEKMKQVFSALVDVIFKQNQFFLLFNV